MAPQLVIRLSAVRLGPSAPLGPRPSCCCLRWALLLAAANLTAALLIIIVPIVLGGQLDATSANLMQQAPTRCNKHRQQELLNGASILSKLSGALPTGSLK